MPTLFRKILLSILAVWIVFFSFVPYFSQVNAAAATPAPEGTWYNSSFQEWYSKVYDDGNPSEIFGERYTAAQVQWVVYGLLSFIINQTSNQKLLSCLMKNSANLDACGSLITIDQRAVDLANSAPVEKTPSLASLVFATDRPFSGISYVKNKADNFSLIPTANAQQLGFGFNALSTVQAMWKTSRDMAFGLFVIAAIVFAFMIMFRVKISPQVVITVQTALPKIIGALILVTFSYAIAGFLVDLMYVVYGIIAVLGKGFIPGGGIAAPATVFQFLTAGRLGVSGAGIEVGILGLIVLYLALFPIAFAIVLFMTIGAIASLILTLITIAAIASPIGTILGIIALILLVIIFIIIVWQSIKTVFALLKAYVNILLLTIFAPIQIVAGVLLPNFGFGAWVRSFVTNLGVFVLTSVLFFFSFIFLEQGVVIAFTNLGGSSGAPVRTFITLIANLFFGQATTSAAAGFFLNNSAWPPLLSGAYSGGGVTGLLMLGVSFVLFTLIPKATEVLQGLMSGRPFAYGTAIGEAMAPVGYAYDKSGAKDYVDALSSIRQNRMWSKILSSRTGRQATETLVGGPRDPNTSAVDMLMEEKRKRSGAQRSRS